jgi:hypothetical protein
LAFSITLNGCNTKGQLNLSFDAKRMIAYDNNKNIIRELEIIKLKGDSISYVCSFSYSKLPKAYGLYEMVLNKENNGYKRYNLSFNHTPCLMEKGFVYKIKGHALGSVDSLIVKLN